MPSPKICCNPLNKKNHSCIYKNLRKITRNCNTKFSVFFGKYICTSCKSRMYKLQNSNNANFEIKKLLHSSNDSDEESDVSNADSEWKTEPPIKKSRSAENNTTLPNSWIIDLKAAISNAKSHKEKVALLTTIPLEWSIVKMRKEFNISRRLASKAKKIHQKYGYGASPPPKIGRKVDAQTLEAVNDFFLSEENCRVMPGRKDFVSVKRNGDRVQEQKRLLLHNINEIHSKFKEKFPQIKISLSTFRRLRPSECISAGNSGTHNVCVCKIHENMRLKFVALKEELLKKHFTFNLKYNDAFNSMLCANPKSECFFSKCTSCPGPSKINNDLKILLESAGISKINFKQWTKTDRYVDFINILICCIVH